MSALQTRVGYIMRRVSAIKAELWLDHSNGAKMTTSQFHVYPATSVTSLNVLLLRSPHAASRPQQRWQLAHCLLSSLCCHGPLGNILQVNWHLTGLVWCGMRGGGAVFWESPISSGGRAFWSVGPRCVSAQSPAPSSSVSLCFPTAPARLHAWQTDRCYLPCISSSGPLSLSTNSPLLAHRLQILSASLPLDKGQYQWQNIFYVWNVAHNKQSSIRFV